MKRNAELFELVRQTLRILESYGVLGIPGRMRPHRLEGKYSDSWECHIELDLLIIWVQIESPKRINLVRLGSHSDLFR